MPMPLVPSYNTTRVYGTWVTQGGTEMRTGKWKVTVPVRVTNATDDVIIPQGLYAQGDLNTTPGLPSLDIQVPCTDDPDNSPIGWQLHIEVTFNDAPGEKYVIDVPVAATDINLRAVVLSQTLPVPQNVLIRGVPGGLAELDGDGDVIDASGEKVTGGSGGVSSWAQIEALADKPVTFEDGVFDVTQYGAKVDGAVDGATGSGDAAGINAAIVAANAAWAATGNARTVYVPPTGTNVALLEAPVVLRSGVTLRVGAGVTLRRKVGVANAIITNAAATPLRQLTGLAMTSGSTTLTSTDGSFSAADVGRSIAILGAHSGNATPQAGSTLHTYVTAVTDANTVTVALAATATVSGQTGWVMGRDRDIAIVGDEGAAIHYGTNATASQQNQGCHSYLRNIDGVTWRGFRISSDLVNPTGGKYAVYFYACTRVRASDLTFNTESDGVHINGRTDDVDIRRIYGNTGDDSVAIVIPDRGGICDGDLGDVTRVVIDTVDTVSANSTNGVKLLPGSYGTQRFTVRDVDVRNVTGTHGGFPVTMGVTGWSADSVYRGGYIERVRLDQISSRNGKFPQSIYITIRDLTVSRVGMWISETGTVADVITVQGCRWTTGNGVTIRGANTTIGTLILRDNQYHQPSTSSGSPFLLEAPVGTVILENQLSGRTAWAAGTFTTTSPVNLHVRGLRSITQTGVVRINTGANVTIREFTGNYPTSATSSVQSGGVLRSRTLDFEFDVSLLAKNAGDLAFNTNASLECGVGPVQCDGTTWKPVAAGQVASVAGKTGAVTLTPSDVGVVGASDTVAGIVELATAAEVTAGTDTTRAVTPAGLKVELDKKAGTATATTTATGLVELATNTEATTGTDTTRAVTPAGLKAGLDGRVGGGLVLLGYGPTPPDATSLPDGRVWFLTGA